MKFFFPDPQDQIDPSFDFNTETRSEWRIRQRDDLYPHEVFDESPYDGILVSKTAVDGAGDRGSRYSMAQRHRLRRIGVKEFFRVKGRPLELMGDCGAFTFVNEELPPVTVDNVIDFYAEGRFDYGISVDHVILGYKQEFDNELPGMSMVPEEWRKRQEITLELANDFLKRSRVRSVGFKPMGVAQGWSPNSYLDAVEKLQKMGYKYIALGGMVPLRTPDILRCLETINQSLANDTQIHLLGVARTDKADIFHRFGVVSFDSTSPLRQAFLAHRDNYYTPDRTYIALRVPQSEGNPKLLSRIRSGELDQSEIRTLEIQCLKSLKDYDAGIAGLDEALEALLAYERIHNPRASRSNMYRETLQDRPWHSCPCSLCKKIGIQIMIFRGAERNKRRGFHNIFVFYNRLNKEHYVTSQELRRLRTDRSVVAETK